jgi:ubiquinone/menaquinone biosynthesis C-methylase UbiE
MSENIHTDEIAQPMGHVAIHETVEEIFKSKLPGKILDVPAGEGALSVRLIKLGFDAVCADLYTEIFKLKDTEIKRGNLDQKLPFEDKSFEYIVCVEGLEHIENPANAIREFSRLIKDQGTLVISVPNIMNIEERLKWLVHGYTSHFKPLSNQALADIEREYGGMEEIALHINPIGYSEVRYLLEKNGFTLEKTYLDKPKKGSWAYFPIIVLIKLINKFTPEQKRKNRWTNELNSKEVLLGGNTLIFEATKN